MFAWAGVPLVVGVVSAVFARRLAHRLTPSLATVLLTVLALTVSLATGVVLSLGGVVALVELPLPSAFGRWSSDVVRDNVPVPTGVALAGGLIAAGLLGSAIRHAARVVGRSRAASAAAAELSPNAGDLLVVDDPAAIAYAVPGRHRRIVVSTGLLQLLDGAERRAMLAHESAHLRHHHHVYVQLGRLAAAANPLMRPVSAAIDLATERWADESAARVVGDRGVVARAVGAAALAGRPAPAGALAGAQSDVVDRVQLLLGHPPRRSAASTATLVVGAVGSWAAVALVVGRVHSLLELAQSITH